MLKAPSHAAGLGHSCSLAKRRRWAVQIWARGAASVRPRHSRTRSRRARRQRKSPGRSRLPAEALLATALDQIWYAAAQATKDICQQVSPVGERCRRGNLSHCEPRNKRPRDQVRGQFGAFERQPNCLQRHASVNAAIRPPRHASVQRKEPRRGCCWMRAGASRDRYSAWSSLCRQPERGS